MFQHRNYLSVALFFGFSFPLLVGTLGWSDFRSSIVHDCLADMLFVHEATFCVNSLAHTFGKQTYSKEHISYDDVITALATSREGYHKYHHEFPHNCRNGICWYHYDPTDGWFACWPTLDCARDLFDSPAMKLTRRGFKCSSRNLTQSRRSELIGARTSRLCSRRIGHCSYSSGGG